MDSVLMLEVFFSLSTKRESWGGFDANFVNEYISGQKSTQPFVIKLSLFWLWRQRTPVHSLGEGEGNQVSARRGEEYVIFS